MPVVAVVLVAPVPWGTVAVLVVQAVHKSTNATTNGPEVAVMSGL
jgi:hypothetical protein